MKKNILQVIFICGLFSAVTAGCQQSNDQNVNVTVSNEVPTESAESEESAESSENNDMADTLQSDNATEAPALGDSTISGEIPDSEEADELSEITKTGYIDSIFDTMNWENTHMSSVGEVCFPVFVVEFPDADYGTVKLPEETLRNWIFTGDDSVAAFYETSSSGRLHLDGDIYFYTARNNVSSYENDKGSLDELVKEIIEYYDEEIDFSKYNKDGDIFMDSFVITFPLWEDRMDVQFWWPSYHQVTSSLYIADNTVISNYIITDGAYNIDNTDKPYFTNTLKHELGHALGLPDYYIPNDEDHYLSVDGLPGPAGEELMDGTGEGYYSHGELGQFSKLQLGWLTWEQVQIMPADAESETFLLPPVTEGGCLLIFPEDQEPDFQSEYFLVEYITPEREWKGFVGEGGVRILHVQATLREPFLGIDYIYGSYSTGIRLLKLVNGNDFYRTGDTVTFENTGAEEGNFGWYKESNNVTSNFTTPVAVTDPGFSIQIRDVQTDNGYIQVDVIRNKQ